MSNVFGPYDAYRRLGHACSRCGGVHADGDNPHTGAQVAADTSTPGVEKLSNDVIETALVRALFPNDALRRRFLRAVGANTARAAIA